MCWDVYNGSQSAGPCMLYRNLDCAFTLYEWQLVILPYDERVLIHSYEMARTF